MAKDRLVLHELLLTFAPFVYHQPPASLKLSYPCIIYKLDDIPGVHANNRKYLDTKRYLVTVVNKNSDTLIPNKLLELPYCGFEDYFVVDNLNHYICSLHW